MHLSIEGRPAEADALRVLGAVLEAGVTLIDTADAYCLDDRDVGHNERLIAKARAVRPGDGAAGRRGHEGRGGPDRTGGGTPTGVRAHLRAACERSLTALRLERIDLYQLHAPDPKVPFAESVGAMAELQREGKVRWIGLSNVSVAQIRAAAVDRAHRHRSEPAESVFPGGALRRGSAVLRRATESVFSPTVPPEADASTGSSRPILCVAAIAARVGVSPHAVVLAWVLAQSPAVLAIPSARTVEHALDSVSAADLSLSTRRSARRSTRREFSRA